MSPIYQAEIKSIGEHAFSALEDDMMIIFGEMAPDDAAEYCFIHSHDQLKGQLAPGGELQIGSYQYPITAVGEVVNKNLAELGHITIRFDALAEAEYPGCLHVKGDHPSQITAGDEIKFIG
jgi:PTS system glucitol/sorbitol-specific IIA component